MAWNENQVPFSIHLGDIVDVRQRNFAGRGTRQERYNYALDKAVCVFNQFKGKTFHVVGNHCVSCFPRAQLQEEYASLCRVSLYCAFCLQTL